MKELDIVYVDRQMEMSHSASQERITGYTECNKCKVANIHIRFAK